MMHQGLNGSRTLDSLRGSQLKIKLGRKVIREQKKIMGGKIEKEIERIEAKNETITSIILIS